MSDNSPGSASYYLEQTDFTLRLARCVGAPGNRCVEAMGEVELGDPAVVEEAMRTIFTGNETRVVCALRSRSQIIHRTTPAEARNHPALLGVRQIASQLAREAAWFAATQARDGTAPTDTPWLAAFVTAKDRSEILDQLDAVDLKPGRLVSAVHHDAGALVKLVTTPTLLLEIGATRSQALLIGRAGVLASAPVSLNIDRIAEAVQETLSLKFRGSAQKLFFTDQYDFTEAGPQIAARLVPALKAELAGLQASGVPTALFCSGLPAQQQWFATQLAIALDLTPVIPDYPAWCEAAGLTFAPPAEPADLPPMCLGFLHMLATAPAGPAPWHAEWLDVVEPKTDPAPAILPSELTRPPMSVATTPAVPVAAKTESAPAAVAVLAKPEPVIVSVTPRVETKPAIVVTPAPAPVQPVQAVAPKPVPVVVPVVEPEFEESAPPFHKKPSVLISIGVAALLAIGGYFYMQHQQQVETERLAEKARTEKRLHDEAERAKLAEQKAREEAAERKKFELNMTQRLAATEAARIQAENEAKSQGAARRANARGRLVVTAEPAGAMVTVGSLAPRPSPATFEDIRVGDYAVHVTLAGYDSAEFQVQIKEDATAEPAPVQLARIIGQLTITSEPVGATFEVRLANSFSVAADARRSGQTPATFPDLVPGDYAVTYTRPGWAPHTENVTVTRNGTAEVAWTFPQATVKITSTPTGAAVMQGDTKLGTTPLVLPNLAPGDARYQLMLPGYQPGALHGRLEGGATLALHADLITTDGLTPVADLESRPVPITQVQPEVPGTYASTQAFIEIEAIVDRTGQVRDPKILRMTGPGLSKFQLNDLGKLCLAAASKWKFKPAVAHGQPVNVRITLPFDLK